jgi:peptidoglycan/xylan/chitin deacetylase (PgdA/CDA1 family)
VPTTARQVARRAKDRLLRLPGTRAFPPRRLKDLRSRGFTGNDAIALTFDDGPDPEVTPKILSALSDGGAKATFFMCGLAAERHPDIVRAVAGEGHAIGGHTWHHLAVRGFSEEDWRNEIDRTHELLASLTRRRVRLFRPPYMDIERSAFAELKKRRLLPMYASASGGDWLTEDPHAIAMRVSREIHRGAIVLLHDAYGDILRPGAPPREGVVVSRLGTAAAVPIVLESVREAGLKCVPLPY